MPLIYLVPFQNVPKIDLTIVSTSFQMAFYALNYSYLINIPLYEAATGTVDQDPLLVNSPTVGFALSFGSVSTGDTSGTDNFILSEVKQVKNISITALSPGDISSDALLVNSVKTIGPIAVANPAGTVAGGDVLLTLNVNQTIGPIAVANPTGTLASDALLTLRENQTLLMPVVASSN